jgi:rod shape determining protein RodA
MPLARKLISFNWLLLLLTLALCGAGLMAIYSATNMRTGRFDYLATSTGKQQLFFYAGVVVMLVTSLIDYRWIRYLAWPGYILSMGLLLFLQFNLSIGPFESDTVYGARSWIKFGGFSFQPAQLAIVSGILLMADIITNLRHRHWILRALACGAAVVPPVGLIYIQPDLGSVLIWIPVTATMIFLSGLPIWSIVLMAFAGATAIPLVIDNLEDHQIKRLTTFMHPEEDIQGEGYNAYYSLVAVGSGGWEGKGYLAEDSVHMLDLPPPITHNDFIFSVIAEEMGFRGAIVIVALEGLLIITLMVIGSQSRDTFGFLVCAAFAAQLFTHCFINMGMTITLVPITGLPLPLVSYGGSFLLLTLFSMGVVQSVWIHRKAGQELTQPIGEEIHEYATRGSYLAESRQNVTPAGA